MKVQELDDLMVRKAIKTMLALGYQLSVHNGGEWAVKRSTSAKAIFYHVRGVDEATVRVHRGDLKDGNIFFVFGNDGYDAINDYACCLEDDLKPVLEYAGKLEMRQWGGLK